jgi:predicted enzyme related to lactoylglutathione lyase
MNPKINHIAIVSQNYSLLAAFYVAAFKFKPASKDRPMRALTVGDGYVGLNINPRKAGRPAGLDHFGIEVDDIETALSRMQRFPGADYVKRPSTRPFAAISANDPDGNVFDLSQKNSANRDLIYAENSGTQAERHFDHVAIRTMRPDEMARFYADVFDLKEQNKPSGDPNHYMSDGKMTIVLMPWKINNFQGQSILPTGLDHFGVTVEDLDAFKADVDEVVGVNPCLNPIPVGLGKEQGARLELAKRQYPAAQHWLADPDFTLIAITERAN